MTIVLRQADARLSQFRLDLKKLATPIVLEHYGLKDGPGCAPLAKALLERNAFLFPGDVMSVSRYHLFDATRFKLTITGHWC
jgi:hypothetical protein